MKRTPDNSSKPAFWIGAILVLSAGSVFAVQDAIAKTLTQTYAPTQVAWLRFALHAALVGLWMHSRGHHRYLSTKRFGVQAARAGALVLVCVSMYSAVSLIPLAQATAVQFFSPILVTLLSVLFLGERIGWRRCLAIVAGFIGVIIVLAPSGSGLSIATLLPLVTALSLAIFVLLTRTLSQPEEKLPAIGLMPVICTVLLLPVMPFVWQTVALSDWPWFLAMACCGTLAHLCLQLGLRVAPASVMSPYLYAQVICAAAISATVFGDPLSSSFALGAAFIVGSGVSIWWLELRAGRSLRSLSKVSRHDA